MDFNQISKYVVGILLLPLTLRTIKALWQNRQKAFDEDLTKADRDLLKQTAVFVMLPLVVLFHECGHALACYYFHLPITAVHWTLFWGEVQYLGGTREAIEWTAASGNLFQLLAVIIALLVAIISSSPAVVALATYTYLWSAFSCLIFYPIVSLVAWRYDFAILYGNEDARIVWAIACLHLVLAWLFIFTFLSTRTRLWFVKKTRPVWAREFAKTSAMAVSEKTSVAYLALAWQYYLVGLDTLAEKTLQLVQKIEPGNLDVWLLRGYIMQSQSKFETADFCFENIVKAEPDRTLRARAYMAKGHCLYEKILQSKKKDMSAVLNSYKQAVESASELADPHYYLAIALKEGGQLEASEAELQICNNSQKNSLTWLDPVLANLARNELINLRSTFKEKK